MESNHGGSRGGTGVVGKSPARMICGDEEAEESDARWGIFTPSPSNGGLLLH